MTHDEMVAARPRRLGTIVVAAAALLGLASSAALAQESTGNPITDIPAAKLAAAAVPADPNNTRVLGGDIADEGAWPWQVGLVSEGADSVFLGQFCGGSMITSRWVLTAAHCLNEDGANGGEVPIDPLTVEVLVGTNYLTGQEGEMIPVQAMFIHPAYEGSTFDNDMALLLLERAPSVPYETIRLPTVNSEARYGAAGRQAILTGWGRLQDGTFPVDLRQVQMSIFDRGECNAAVPGEDPVSNNMLCVGEIGGGIGSCSGDSGGPLVVSLDDGSFMQVGVTSWGFTSETSAAGCSLDAEFSVFARVANYQDWIRDTVTGGN